MIDGIDKKELVLLKFTKEQSKTELDWEHSKEFEYAGEMYDVVEETIKGDSIYYYCWWDHEETKLNKQLSDLVTKAMGQNQQNKENQNRLQNFLKTLYHFDANCNPPLPTLLTKNVTMYAYSCITFSGIPLTPPPEVG